MSSDYHLVRPSLVLETSWEVCNKVGGIYTVLSSRAASMVKAYGRENVLFVGPFLRNSLTPGGEFVPDTGAPDRDLSQLSGLPVYSGSWQVPGAPKALLVDFAPLYEQKGDLYYEMWEQYGIRSELGYGDYDESCLFAIAAALVMSAVRTVRKREFGVVTVFNEWTTGMGLLWMKRHEPSAATLFITHATSVGRSIAGNGKNLYAYLDGYNGDQMARELGVEAKHTIEKLAAHNADCFATVSEVTAAECAKLLEKRPDAVLENGFEPLFVPDRNKRAELRGIARKRILRTAEVLYGRELYDDALIVMTGGRFEYRNKGLDLFVETLAKLARERRDGTAPDIVALIAVPGWVQRPRGGLVYGLGESSRFTMPMISPFFTHWIGDLRSNLLIAALGERRKLWGENIFPIYLPAYLDGKDGILGLTYYDLLPGTDLTAFPSYYEPWGYTPLESIAFGVPTITTDKAGFGKWARAHLEKNDLSEGVLVVPRDDENFSEASDLIAQTITRYGSYSLRQRKAIQERAQALSGLADWGHFFSRYEEAFDHALSRHN